jgi:hypothetical protein
MEVENGGSWNISVYDQFSVIRMIPESPEKDILTRGM